MHVFELTRRLIEIPSISGDEKAVAEFLADYLEHAGFTVAIQEAVPGGAVSRPNVWARLGDPDIVLSSHTDTVPPYIEFREDDDHLYGRGACDAKGIIAAMIKAAEGVRESGVTDLGLLFVVGEEAGSAGAMAANAIPNRSRFLINGEPTRSRLALGSKGAVRARLTVSGRAAHSAYPEMGESAIDKLLDILGDLRRAELPFDARLGATTLNIGLIKGGVATNVIAPEAEAEMLFRIVTRAEPVVDLLEAVVGDRGEVTYSFACDAVFMESLEGFETEVVAFTTDIPLLSAFGKPLLFGPGSILDAHTEHERISRTELLRAIDVYREMIIKLKARI